MLVFRIKATTTFVLTLFAAFSLAEWFSSVAVIVPCAQYHQGSAHYGKEDQCASYRSAISNGRPIVTLLTDFVDDHDGAFTAIATVVIAAFTITLWQATATHASHMEQMLAITRNVERAYVYPVIVSTDDINGCINRALVCYPDDATKADTPSPERVSIVFQIKNYGKTPAVLRAAYTGFGVHPIGALLGLSIPESILGPTESTTDLVSELQIGITRNQAIGINAYHHLLAFDGEVHFQDIWGNKLTTKFIFGWDKEIERMTLRDVTTTEDTT